MDEIDYIGDIMDTVRINDMINHCILTGEFDNFIDSIYNEIINNNLSNEEFRYVITSYISCMF